MISFFSLDVNKGIEKKKNKYRTLISFIFFIFFISALLVESLT